LREAEERGREQFRKEWAKEKEALEAKREAEIKAAEKRGFEQCEKDWYTAMKKTEKAGAQDSSSSSSNSDSSSESSSESSSNSSSESSSSSSSSELSSSSDSSSSSDESEEEREPIGKRRPATGGAKAPSRKELNKELFGSSSSSSEDSEEEMELAAKKSAPTGGAGAPKKRQMSSPAPDSEPELAPVKKKLAPIENYSDSEPEPEKPVLPSPALTGGARAPRKPVKPAPGSGANKQMAGAKKKLLLATLTVMCMMIPPLDAFTAYDCSYNQSVVLEAYSLLEPAPCGADGYESRFERTVSAEIIQQRRETVVPIFRCQIFETVFTQYCGHSSAAGVLRYLKFRQPLLVEPAVCRAAKARKGKISVNGQEINGKIGGFTTHTYYLVGGVDESYRCEVGTINTGTLKLDYQTAQTALEVALYEDFGKINELTGYITLPGGIQVKTADGSAVDSLMGVMVWEKPRSNCPDSLTQLFRGTIKIHTNTTKTFTGGVAILEENKQVAGLELGASFVLCNAPAYRTHIKDIVVVMHPDNVSSVAFTKNDPSAVSEITRLESEFSFLHVKKSLGHQEVVRQIKLAVCENKREITMARLESIAGADNQYSLISMFGRGHLSTRAGATVYVTKCPEVDVTPRLAINCSQEIPVVYNGQNMFVDPISLVLLTHGETVICNDVAPPRWLIAGRWYCGFSNAIRECHEPPKVPIGRVEIETEEKLPWGLGRSIYTPEQMTEFYDFQHSLAVRNAFVADQAELAYINRGDGGEWGLSLGTKAQETLMDLFGLNFIPLYWMFGPAAINLIFILFFVGMARVVGAILLRLVLLIRVRGCGLWVFAAPFAALYHLAMTPLLWVDAAARQLADRIQRAMEEAANDPNGDGGYRRRTEELQEVVRNIGRAALARVGTPVASRKLTVANKPEEKAAVNTNESMV